MYKTVFLYLFLVISFLPVKASLNGDTLVIAHMCDTQIGFGRGGIEDDLANFYIAIDKVNLIKPDLVVIAGDMVNRMTPVSIELFKQAASNIEAPLVLTPGNHDIAEPVTDAGLMAYRNAFGSDYTEMNVKGRTLLAFNSMLMRSGPAEEVEACDSWLDEKLANAHAAGSPVILVSHIPPFAKSVDEADEYFNLPLATRDAMLRSFADRGVFLWLAGHTHVMSHNTHAGIDILNAENTSKNFDGRPKGFRLLRIAPDNSFTWELIAN